MPDVSALRLDKIFNYTKNIPRRISSGVKYLHSFFVGFFFVFAFRVDIVLQNVVKLNKTIYKA